MLWKKSSLGLGRFADHCVNEGGSEGLVPPLGGHRGSGLARNLQLELWGVAVGDKELLPLLISAECAGSP